MHGSGNLNNEVTERAACGPLRPDRMSTDGATARARGREQALRARAGARGRRLRGARRRGGGPRGRQRRGQVHAREVDLGHPRHRRGQDPVRGPAREDQHPERCRRAGDRDRLPGPGAVRQPRRGRQPVPRARADRLGRRRGDATARRDHDGAPVARAARAVRRHDPERALGGGRPLRRPAPAGRGGAVAAGRAEGRAARRAHGRARRRADGDGAGADQAAA